MSEKKREKKVAAGRKLLQQYQQRNGPARPRESKKGKMKEGGNPKTNTTGDCPLLKGAAQDHADPEPPPSLGTVTAARIQSVTGPNNTKDLERHNQHLVLALDSSTIQKQHLCTEIQELQDQQGKDKEKMACVHEALKAELEQHKLSIQMLIREKADLQSALAHKQQEADERALEQEGLTSCLQAAQQRVTELETTLSAVNTTQNETENNNIELMKALNRVKLQLQEKARSIEDLEDENTELQERLEVLLTQKADMKMEIHKFQEELVERAELESQLNNMKELVAKLKEERDTFGEDLRLESSTGKEKVQQLLEQVSQLREEKEQGVRQVLELESKLVELREQLSELRPPEPPAGPAQAEQQLQAHTLQLQKELKTLEEQLHLQVEENQSLSLQNLEQQQRLWILEKKAEEWAQHAEDRRKILETIEKEQETLKRTLVHNRQLKEELAQLQDALQRLSAEKGELASILHTEQQEKTTLQAKLDELEEEFKEGKDVAEFKRQAAEDLQELHDKYLAQVQELSATCKQHKATSQQLMSEKEALQQHLLNQSHLMEQLKQEQVQSKLLAQMEREKLQDTLKCLEATRQENAQLRAQLSALAFPREDEGLSQDEDKGEEATTHDVTVPDDVDNPQSMWDFYMDALSIAEGRKARMSRQLQEQQARCGCLSQLAAQCQRKLESQAAFPQRCIHRLFGKRKQDTQAPKKQLHICFPEDLASKGHPQSHVDDLHHRCSQLTQHLTTMEETIVLYKEQLEVLEKLCQEKEQCVSQLSQEKRRKRKELKELLLRLTGESTECQDMMLAAAQAPAAEAPSDLSVPLRMEVREERQGCEDVHLQESLKPVPGEAGAPGPLENPIAEPPVPLLPAIQPQQEPTDGGEESCLPFFYKPQADDVFEIITI
ncbi:golgin subfamily A member 2-like [Dipodomys spectabilis]|uniref:golgin subfamily A member 2-like n=1 Tax=Dipodomys spectabilis TaxID=105255 RepID=UPI001C53FD2D|nr:golgin subfamily A member 2-like [Dipodomys spectabilis]